MNVNGHDLRYYRRGEHHGYRCAGCLITTCKPLRSAAPKDIFELTSCRPAIFGDDPSEIPPEIPEPPGAWDDRREFTRQELQELRARARWLRTGHQGERWRCYRDLQDTVSFLDAILAREELESRDG